MSYQDRYSSHDSEKGHSSPMGWFWGGSLALFRVAGVTFRIHATLLLLIIMVMLLGAISGFSLIDRAVFLAMLLVVVAIHQSVQAIATAKIGGYVDDVVLWPLGGLDEGHPPRRPMTAFTIALLGPVSMLATCAASASVLHAVYHIATPLSVHGLAPSRATHFQVPFYLWYLYLSSYMVLLLNLVPALPLDSGRMLHAVLWSKMGYGRAMLAACTLGVVAAAVVGAYGIYCGEWYIIAAMVLVLFYCLQKRLAVRAAGVSSFDDFDSAVSRPRRHHLSRFVKWQARRQIRQEETETVRVDAILRKIHDRGLKSLTWIERRILRRATSRQREREPSEHV